MFFFRFWKFLFLLEKNEFRNVKFKSKFTHKLFYRLIILFYVLISLALIPLGYIGLGLMIIIIPLILLFKRFVTNDDFD